MFKDNLGCAARGGHQHFLLLTSAAKRWAMRDDKRRMKRGEIEEIRGRETEAAGQLERRDNRRQHRPTVF